MGSPPAASDGSSTTEVIEDAVDHLGLRDEGNAASGLRLNRVIPTSSPLSVVEAVPS